VCMSVAWLSSGELECEGSDEGLVFCDVLISTSFFVLVYDERP
jgi:hypothetical protein